LGELGVAVEKSGDDAVPLVGRQALDSTVGKGGALAVAADKDLYVWTLYSDEGDEELHLGDAGRVSAAGEEVRSQHGEVLDTLDSDSGGSEAVLEPPARLQPAHSAHITGLGRAAREEHHHGRAPAIDKVVGAGADARQADWCILLPG